MKKNHIVTGVDYVENLNEDLIKKYPIECLLGHDLSFLENTYGHGSCSTMWDNHLWLKGQVKNMKWTEPPNQIEPKLK